MSVVKDGRKMANGTPTNGVPVALITAGATIVANQNVAGWVLIAAGLVVAKRDRGE